MSRNPKLEALHAALFDGETASGDDKEAALRNLHRLLDSYIADSGLRISRYELLDAIRDDYREFKRMKRRESWARLKK